MNVDEVARKIPITHTPYQQDTSLTAQGATLGTPVDPSLNGTLSERSRDQLVSRTANWFQSLPETQKTLCRCMRAVEEDILNLEFIPVQVFRDHSMKAFIVQLAEEQGPKIYNCFPEPIRQSAQFMLKHEVFSITPEKVTLDVDNDQLVELIKKAPTPIGLQLIHTQMGGSIATSRLLHGSHFQDLTNISDNMSTKMSVETGGEAPDDEALYQDPVSVVNTSNTEEYISEINTWLTRQGIETYCCEDLFKPDKFLEMTDEENADAVLFLSEKDFNLIPDLKKLLKTGCWKLDKRLRQFAAKIVVVGNFDNLPEEIFKYARYHTDLKSIRMNSIIKKGDEKEQLKMLTSGTPREIPKPSVPVDISDISIQHILDFSDDDAEELKGRFLTGSTFSNYESAGELFDRLMKFSCSDYPVLSIEGTGKDFQNDLIQQYFHELCAISPNNFHYSQIEREEGRSVIDQVNAERRKKPEHLLFVHISNAEKMNEKEWNELLGVAQLDDRIKIVGSYVPSYPKAHHSLIDPTQTFKLNAPKSKDLSQMVIKKFGLKDSVAKVLVDFHQKLSEKVTTKNKILSLNTLTAFSEVISECDDTLDEKEFYEIVFRIYGSYIVNLEIGSLCEGLVYSDLIQAMNTEEDHEPLDGKVIREETDFSFDTNDKEIEPVWTGENSNYLTDVFPNSDQLSPKSKETSPTLATSTKIEPDESISLVTFPNMLPLRVSVHDESTGEFISTIDVSATGEPMRWTNDVGIPVTLITLLPNGPKLYTDHKEVPELSEEQIPLSEQEYLLLKEIIHYSSKHPVSELSDEDSVVEIDTDEGTSYLPSQRMLDQLADIFEIEDRDDSKQIVSGVFKYFSTFSWENFHHKPLVGDLLDEKHTHLLHSFLSLKGVCRHQAELIKSILNAFGVITRVHENENHMFAVIGVDLILNVEYFDKDDIDRKHIFEELKEIRQKATKYKEKTPPKDARNLDKLLSEADSLLDNPHKEGVTYEVLNEGYSNIQSAIGHDCQSELINDALDEARDERPSKIRRTINHTLGV